MGGQDDDALVTVGAIQLLRSAGVPCGTLALHAQRWRGSAVSQPRAVAEPMTLSLSRSVGITALTFTPFSAEAVW